MKPRIAGWLLIALAICLAGCHRRTTVNPPNHDNYFHGWQYSRCEKFQGGKWYDVPCPTVRE